MNRLVCCLLFLAVLAGPACNTVDTLETDIDLEPFRILARTDTGCADLVNRLFLIDGRMVFRQREGRCADDGYAYRLYGATPDDVLCETYDSIAGRQMHCRPDLEALFETMIYNLDAPDLGLGRNHRVEPIPF